MLKNKLKTIALIMLIILSLIVPQVNAEDNEAEGQTSNTVQEEATAISTDPSTTSVNAQNYKEGDVYLTGDEITIDYVVDGNLFVMANKVTISSQIGGDAFIIANDIIVENNGYIFSNLFALAPNITISGVVYDLYAYANNIQVNNYIFRDARAIANNFKLAGTIGRNAYLNIDNMEVISIKDDQNNVTSQGSIKGDLNYSSKQELEIQDGTVSGDINYTQLKTSSPSIQTYLLSIGGFLVTVLIIWLIGLWLAPKFLERTNLVLTKKLPSTIALGIFTPIVLIIALVILLLLNITSSVSLLGLALLFVACAISSSIFVIAVNNIICNKLNVEKTIVKLGFLIITGAVLWLIALIPFVGRVISTIAAILGLGILINAILPHNRNLSGTETKVKAEKKENKKESKNKNKEDKKNK